MVSTMRVPKTVQSTYQRQFQQPHTRQSVRHPEKQNQQTLTQIDFAPVLRDGNASESVDDYQGSYETDDNAIRPVKKRRVVRSSEEEQQHRKKQQTLTQIPFFDRDESPYGYDDQDDHSETKHTQVNGSDKGDNELGMSEGSDQEFDVMDEDLENVGPQCYRDVSPSPISRRVRASALRESDQNHALATHRVSNFTKPITPLRLIKREIPSSQSPISSPISTCGMTPKRQRSPLRELSQKELTVREKSPLANKRRRLVVEDSTATALSDDDEIENLLPSSSALNILSNKASSKKKTDPASSGSQHASYLEFSPAAGPSDSIFKKPYSPIHSSQATTADATQTSHRSRPFGESSSQTFGFETLPLLPIAQQMSLSGTSTSVPVFDDYDSPPPPDLSSSQPLASQFMLDESPLTPIHDSADILSTSQLLPSSL